MVKRSCGVCRNVFEANTVGKYCSKKCKKIKKNRRRREKYKERVFSFMKRMNELQKNPEEIELMKEMILKENMERLLKYGKE